MSTKKQFRQFVQESVRWIALFGLTDWEISFTHEDRDIEDCMAWCSSDIDGRVAVIGLNRAYKMQDKEVSECARHEAIELLLSPLDILARRRYVCASEIESARHAIVRRLENAL